MPTGEKLSLRLLMLIASQKLADEAAELFRSAGIPLMYALHGEGTVSSEMLDILGLVQTEKGVLLTTLPKSVADEMLKRLYKELKLSKINSGIALTFPLNGTSNLTLRMLEGFDSEEHAERKEDTNMSESKYSMISVVVNHGFSEAVMNVARSAGAGGGTVIHSRRISDDKSISLWGLGVQEEKEIVLIVADTEHKLSIMQAISKECGMHSDAKGIVLSVPVDSVLGLD